MMFKFSTLLEVCNDRQDLITLLTLVKLYLIKKQDYLHAARVRQVILDLQNRLPVDCAAIFDDEEKRLARIREETERQYNIAVEILDGNRDNYDGADGARIIKTLCGYIESLL